MSLYVCVYHVLGSGTQGCNGLSYEITGVEEKSMELNINIVIYINNKCVSLMFLYTQTGLTRRALIVCDIFLKY